MPVLTFLTDFGLEDYYVAAVKGTVLRLAPDTQVVDVSHLVPAGDVETGAFLLAAAFSSFPAGTVHLAVVDPGVGSSRRILVAAVPSENPSDPPSWLVAPDNGLLTHLLPAALPVRSVERSDLFLQGPGQTFHGRDRFAPVAAWLLRGEPAKALGPEIHDPQRLEIEPPRRDGRQIAGRVAHVDRYGNLVTDIPARWLPDGPLLAEVGFHSTRHRASHYAEMPPGEAAVLPGSLGTVEISVNGEDLASRWKVSRGDPVRIVW